MSSVFSTYVQLGFHHIFDFQAYDHMLFLLALSAIYTLSDWKKVIALVTSFTIGHSITLALAVFEVIRFDTALIEFLIPVTIFLTCVTNFFKLKGAAAKQPTILSLHNLMAIFFGLVHGMGFSNFLRAMLGRSGEIWEQLLAFNIGIELGQLLIVSILLIIGFLVLNLFHAKKRDWIMVLSSAAAGISLILMMETSIF
ncbi:HupE/UreJ protein [Pontibacter ummariensis]|uniref:HupE / UreJ protein n=1 Tax=Pontibacter ummariensis TaxID=1610492 RepID=A0A239HNW7_9BACT|nr:HupE/UreJ family protein [Pontibacter ummariensis]PRY10358.1 HupE/UreJ protein [Pontibacter ummariensis]SNS83002.1 HupE / UreJ protein [Pontibacter ummariensis]